MLKITAKLYVEYKDLTLSEDTYLVVFLQRK